MRTSLLALLAAALSAPTAELSAQDLNIPLPVDSIEYLLAYAPFELPDDLTGTRFQGDRTMRVDLRFDANTTVLTKWAPAPPGAEAFNNVPRYEVAAFRIQRLFLADDEIVVPPTVMRALPLDWYRTLEDDVDRTFRGAEAIIVVLQSFVNFVTDEGVWDEDRFDSDPAYARHWANANLLTYLIRHSDSNTGNLLISSFGSNPRVFSVDNGVAFNSIESDRGTRWRSLQVDRFPAATVERMRTLTEEQFHDALGVLAQWEVGEDEQLIRVPVTENIDSRRGVRQRDGQIQIGLTRDEIEDSWYRLEVFLGNVGNGRYQTF
ncbi:MAG: hypothetical protein OEN00_06880 [Gemmatimonadota bacterium]|nr:hypothetical protein [Gemmatimonadota bacterium]